MSEEKKDSDKSEQQKKIEEIKNSIEPQKVQAGKNNQGEHRGKEK